LPRIDRLARFPNIGRAVRAGLRRDYREVVSKPCRVIYRVEAGIVLIVHVRRFEQHRWPDDL